VQPAVAGQRPLADRPAGHRDGLLEPDVQVHRGVRLMKQPNKRPAFGAGTAQYSRPGAYPSPNLHTKRSPKTPDRDNCPDVESPALTRSMSTPAGTSNA
jgi:hypothetical protein